jgi:phage shock protein A
MLTILATLVLLVVLLTIVNLPSLIRSLRARPAETKLLVAPAEELDPLALLTEAVNDGVASIHNAKKGLENYRELISSVQGQVEAGEREQARLETRIQEAIDAGDPNHTAHDNALMLAEVEQHLATNREQLQRHKETYERLARQVETGQKRVAAARQKAATLGLELEQSEREKEMARFAQKLSFNPEGLDTDLARVEELIHQKIEANRAVGHVADTLPLPSSGGSDDEEEKRKAAAAKILERFAKKPPMPEG